MRTPGSAAALARVSAGGRTHLALWRDGRFFDLRPLTLDVLLRLSLGEIRTVLDRPDRGVVRPDELAAPVESQEVWGAGVTYRRSREARLEESREPTIYEQVYDSARPELFFKAAGWRVIGDGGEVGVRADSTWDVPEPELAVLTNSAGEIVAYACGNDMSSRSIEGENPLFLPQAKIYDRSCAIGPVAVLAWGVEMARATIRMTIDRSGAVVYDGESSVASMRREIVDLVSDAYSSYTFPVGAWLLTGAALVPPRAYTARPGDVVRIAIDGLGELVNGVVSVGRGPRRGVDRLAAGSHP